MMGVGVGDDSSKINYQNMEKASKVMYKQNSQLKKMANYEVIKIIGKGGFSKVLLVRQRSSGKLFAMKIINKEMIKKRGKIKQIMTERNILLKSKHPYIIQLEEAFQSKYHLHLVLEFCPGGELFYHLQMRRRFTEAQTRFIAAQIICALEYLHSNDILYRDLKPENVLVDIEGHIKISDFGLSRENFKFNNLSDSFCGSPEYISPEMLLRGIHTRMIDFYQLGALLYEILTGLPPNYNEDKDQMYQCIMKEQPELPDYLSPQVKSLLDGLLQKQPEKRIGYQGQFEELKSHEFFMNVNWQKIINKDFETQYPSQIRHVLRPILGKSYFDTTYIEKLSEEFIKELYEEKQEAAVVAAQSPSTTTALVNQRHSNINNEQQQQMVRDQRHSINNNNMKEKVQQESDLLPTNRVIKIQGTGLNQQKLLNDELKHFEDSNSPLKLNDQLLQNETIGVMNNITGSGNLVFGKSIKNMKNQVEQNNNEKDLKIKNSSPVIQKHQQVSSSTINKKQVPIMQNIKSSENDNDNNFSNPQSPNLLNSSQHYQQYDSNSNYIQKISKIPLSRKSSSFINITINNNNRNNIYDQSSQYMPAVGSGQIPYLGEKLLKGDDDDDIPSFESEGNNNKGINNSNGNVSVSVSVSPDYTPIDRLIERTYDDKGFEDFNIGNLVNNNNNNNNNNHQQQQQQQHQHQQKKKSSKKNQIFEIQSFKDNNNKDKINSFGENNGQQQQYNIDFGQLIEQDKMKELKLISNDFNMYENEAYEIVEQRCKSLTPQIERQPQHLYKDSQSNIFFDQFNFDQAQIQNLLMQQQQQQQNVSNTNTGQTLQINNKQQKQQRKHSQIEQLTASIIAPIIISTGQLNLKELPIQHQQQQSSNSSISQIKKQDYLNSNNRYQGTINNNYMKAKELNERYTLNLLKFNEKLNNIVSERKRNPPTVIKLNTSNNNTPLTTNNNNLNVNSNTNGQRSINRSGNTNNNYNNNYNNINHPSNNNNSKSSNIKSRNQSAQKTKSMHQSRNHSIANISNLTGINNNNATVLSGFYRNKNNNNKKQQQQQDISSNSNSSCNITPQTNNNSSSNNNNNRHATANANITISQQKQIDRLKYINNSTTVNQPSTFNEMIKTIKVQENKIDFVNKSHNNNNNNANNTNKNNYPSKQQQTINNNNNNLSVNNINSSSKSPMRRNQSTGLVALNHPNILTKLTTPHQQQQQQSLSQLDDSDFKEINMLNINMSPLRQIFNSKMDQIRSNLVKSQVNYHQDFVKHREQQIKSFHHGAVIQEKQQNSNNNYIRYQHKPSQSQSQSQFKLQQQQQQFVNEQYYINNNGNCSSMSGSSSRSKDNNNKTGIQSPREIKNNNNSTKNKQQQVIQSTVIQAYGVNNNNTTQKTKKQTPGNNNSGSGNDSSGQQSISASGLMSANKSRMHSPSAKKQIFQYQQQQQQQLYRNLL